MLVGPKAIAWMIVCFAAIPSARAADMTAREVTAFLFAAPPGKTPNLSHKDLSDLDLSGLDFKKAKLDGANLYGADLTGANLSGASLKAARLDRATLIGTNLSEADLSGASVLRPNVSVDMEAPRKPILSFKNAKLVGAHLNGRFDSVDFSNADLTSAIFGPRDPREEVLITPMASLAAANFTGATMVECNLSMNSLENANFTGADLLRANLRGARLGGANFSGANLDGANLTDTRGLQSVIGLSATR